MDWQTIRAQYPNRWVLIEALDATTQDNQRVISSIRLIASFGDDWREAWESYKTHHHKHPNREFYPVHTTREVLNIGVLDSFGRILPATSPIS